LDLGLTSKNLNVLVYRTTAKAKHAVVSGREALIEGARL